MDQVEELVGHPTCESFIPSPIVFSTYYDHVLQAEIDPLCHNSLVSLFVQFAGDYFYSCNFSQDPADPRYPGRESAWSTIVRSFLESPISVQYLRDLTKLFQTHSLGPAGHQTRPHRNESARNKLFSIERADTFPVQEQMKSFPRLPASFAVPEPNFDDFSTSHFSPTENQWQPTTYQNQKKSRRSEGFTEISFRVNNQERVERGTWQGILCAKVDCSNQANYNWPGQKKLFCANHCSPGMVCTRTRMCVHEGCTKQPFF